MRSSRFHIDTALTVGADVVLPAATAHYMTRVLRLHENDNIVLFNGDGHDYAATLVHVGKKSASARLVARTSVNNMPPFALQLVQCLAKGEKMDWIVQKATELGVSRITPIMSTRCDVRLQGERAHKRLNHWQAVAIAACEQSGRATVPHIDAPQTLASYLQQASLEAATHLALVPDADAKPLRDIPHDTQGYAVLVGPEGGLDPDEIDALANHAFVPASLGPRVLRTETAGLAALAAINALHGGV